MLILSWFVFLTIFVARGYGLHKQYAISLNTYNTLNGLINSESRFKRSDCAQECVVTMGNKVNSQVPELADKGKQLGDDPTALITVSSEEFNKYCQNVIKPFFKCMDNCPSSTVKTLMAEAFDTVKMLCLERFQDVIDNYDCFQKKSSISNNQCTRGTCKSLTGAVTTFVAEGENLIKSGDWNRYKQLLSDNCKFTNCSYECEKSITDKTCGINNTIARSLNNELVYKAVRSLKNVLSMAKKVDYWPQECETIIQSTSSEAASVNSSDFRNSVSVTTPYNRTAGRENLCGIYLFALIFILVNIL